MSVLRLSVVRGVTPLGAIFGVILLAGGLVVRVLGLDHLPYSFCMFKLMTGLPCMTCGSTRAVGRLFHFDLAGAFLMNPLATAGALVLVPWALGDLALLPRGGALSLETPEAARNWLRALVVAVVLANWAYLIAAGR